MTSPETLILIQEAKLLQGRGAELATLLEFNVNQKNICISELRYEDAARFRSNEVDLVREIKKLMKRD